MTMHPTYAEQLINKLKAENAELRERLDNAIELPSGDRVWYIAEDEEGQESYIIPKPTSLLAVEELKYETVYTVIKNCTHCQHYNMSWAECRAPATANFDCEATHRTCFTQDIIEDECKKHLFVAEMKFDLVFLDPKTGKLLPYHFTDRKAAEARLKELQGGEK